MKPDLHKVRPFYNPGSGFLFFLKLRNFGKPISANFSLKDWLQTNKK